MMDATVSPAGGGIAPDLKPVIDIEQYRLDAPLQATPLCAFEGDKPVCLVCGCHFNVSSERAENSDGAHPPNRYGLCLAHYFNAFCGADPDGRRAVESKIQGIVPYAYHSAEFSSFDTKGVSSWELKAARNRVVDWARACVGCGVNGTAALRNIGSLYLYADRTRSYTGNGCGKTHLAYSAFKYIVRRTASCDTHLALGGHVFLPCAFIDIQDLAAQFHRKRDRDGTVCYNYDDWEGKKRSSNFDTYLAHLARAPVLFIDDIGSGSYGNKACDLNFAGKAFEALVDQRSQNGLPTLYTSNYSPSQLGDIVGTRACSRIFRGNSSQLRLFAPDYAMAQSSLGGALRVFSTKEKEVKVV